MRLRQLVLACGLTSLVLSSYVSALGLGEVKLNSTLNQPLEAEIKLLDTRDLTADQIVIALASPADFERNGVDRLFFYTEFEFKVDLAAAGGPKVVITSRNPVREPYLNFLIEARWTAGRLLREYTLLMDLPTFDEGRSTQAVQSAVTRTTKQAPRTTTSAPKTPADTGSTSESRQSASTGQPSLSGNEYQIRSNDTLWEIALRARPESSVSVHQSMMALYRANPEAFISGNINRLRRGQVLRVPDASEMKSLSKSEAVIQFAQATGDSESGAQLSASRRANSARSESAEVSGRVKLAAPTETSTNAGQGSGANDGAGKALEAELAVTLEELDKSKAENTELSSRVKDLEAQIETMERLVEVSNEKLRALQVAATQAAASSVSQVQEAPVVADPVIAEPAVVEPPVVEPPVAEPVAEVAAIASSEAALSSVAAVVPPEPVSPPPTPPQKVITPPKPQPTLVDTLIQNALWIGLGVLGLAAVAYFAYRRRKQAEEQEAEEQDDVFAMDDSVAEQEELVEIPDRFEQADQISQTDEDSETTTVAETGDVVGEADIYIAYGKLDQAEEMLLNALQKDPASADIRMKLLEVYSQQQNAPAFDKHYAALLPLAGGALLARASELRETIPGAGEFAPVAAATEASQFDFELDLDDDEPKAVANAPEAVENEFELDFDEEVSASDTDDLSGLTLDIDSLAAEDLSEFDSDDSSLTESEFNFDLEDDLELNEPAPEKSTALVAEDNESLDVSADDFNLDMNVDDVDLAALDHEMESLDVDFDDDLLDEDFATEELHLTDAEDLSPARLNLTDDLEQSELSMEFESDDDTFSLEDDGGMDLAALEDELSESAALAAPEPVRKSPASTALAETGEEHDEDLFAEALSDFPNESDDISLQGFSSDEAALADLSDDDMDAELDFLADADEAATKLDLARAYIDMGDNEGAKDILSEVLGEGNDVQRKEAKELLGRIG